jgi:hypothetical protein
MNLDLTGISWSQLLIAAVVVAIIDTVTGVLGAIAGGTFSAAFLPEFLSSHVLNRVLPIAAAAYLGGVVLAGTSGGQVIFGTALTGLGAYIIATFPSVGANLGAVNLPSISVSRSKPAPAAKTVKAPVVAKPAPVDPGVTPGSAAAG